MSIQEIPVIRAVEKRSGVGLLSAADIRAIEADGDNDLRFVETIRDPDDDQSAFEAVQAALQAAHDQGRNRTRVGIEDFKVASVLLQSNKTPHLIFMHRTTRRVAVISAYPPPRLARDKTPKPITQADINQFHKTATPPVLIAAAG